MKKKILIYADFYFPDVASIGQILQELAEGLLSDFEVSVISSVPSYTGKIDSKYKTSNYFEENIHGVRVLRVRVAEFDKQNKLSRVKSMLSYFLRSMIATKKIGQQDYILSISEPPILGGLLGLWGKWLNHAKFIYDIQDFNPEQIMAVGYSKNRLLLKLMKILDKFTCRHSDLVVTVGRDLVKTLNDRFNNNNVPKVTLINNWTDEQAIYPVPKSDVNVHSFLAKYFLQDKFVIMYSGNIGLYYDLDNIMRVIEKFPAGFRAYDGREVAFVFVGEGALVAKLKSYVLEHKMENVVFAPYQPKSELLYSLNAADVHWCVSAKGIKGVSCPSKFYGIAAAGKPVLGVLERGSEIESLIRENEGGLLAEPGDYSKIESNIKQIIGKNVKLQQMGTANRSLVLRQLTKTISINKYIEVIKKL